MKDFALVKTVAAAVLCGMGATAGILLYPKEGAAAWVFAGIVIVLGFVVAAIPLPRRRSR